MFPDFKRYLVERGENVPWWWPPAGYTRLDTSGLAWNGPALVWGVILSGTGTAGGFADLYDGQNANGRRFGRFSSTSQGATSVGLLPKPVLFAAGVWAEMNANMDEVTVLFDPL